MSALPQPADLTSLVVRTDFDHEHAWRVVQGAIDSADEYRNATYLDDPAYAGITVQELVVVDTSVGDDAKVFYLFLADTLTMTDAEHPLLAVDLYHEPAARFESRHAGTPTSPTTCASPIWTSPSSPTP